MLIGLARLHARSAARAGGAGTATPFTEDDVAAIRARGAGRAARGGAWCSGTAVLVAGNANWTTHRATASSRATSTCATGRSPRAASSPTREVRGGAQVAVLGADRGRRAVRRRRPDRPDDRASATCRSRSIGVLERKGQTPLGQRPGRHRAGAARRPRAAALLGDARPCRPGAAITRRAEPRTRTRAQVEADRGAAARSASGSGPRRTTTSPSATSPSSSATRSRDAGRCSACCWPRSPRSRCSSAASGS